MMMKFSLYNVYVFYLMMLYNVYVLIYIINTFHDINSTYGEKGGEREIIRRQNP